MELVFDIPPRDLHPNARPANWRVRHGARSRYRNTMGQVAALLVLEQCGARPRWTAATIRLVFYFPKPKRGGFKKHDPDNLIAWSKTAIDALTDGGVLADDRDVIYLPPEQNVLPADSPGRLEITVEPWEMRVCPFCHHATKLPNDSPGC